MVQRDPLAIGLGALLAGLGLGGGVITLAEILANALRRRLDAADYQQAVPDPLFAGLLAALVVGALFGWRRSHGVDNLWQRGVIAMLAAVGALLVGFLGAVADRLLGLPGLVVWGLAAVAVGLAGSRWATRAAS
jgi:MYXO-CTERM domain-containing protein